MGGQCCGASSREEAAVKNESAAQDSGSADKLGEEGVSSPFEGLKSDRSGAKKGQSPNDADNDYSSKNIRETNSEIIIDNDQERTKALIQEARERVRAQLREDAEKTREIMREVKGLTPRGEKDESDTALRSGKTEEQEKAKPSEEAAPATKQEKPSSSKEEAAPATKQEKPSSSKEVAAEAKEARKAPPEEAKAPAEDNAVEEEVEDNNVAQDKPENVEVQDNPETGEAKPEAADAKPKEEAAPEAQAKAAPAKAPVMMQVQIPPGSGPGTVVQVQAPDGRLVQVTVPAGVKPGSTITVQI